MPPSIQSAGERADREQRAGRRNRRRLGWALTALFLLVAIPTARAEQHRPGWFYDHVVIRWESALGVLKPGVTLAERRQAAELARGAARVPGVARVTWPTLGVPGGWRGVDMRNGPTAAMFSVVLLDGREAELVEVAGSMAQLIERADEAGFDLRVRVVHERGSVVLDNVPIDVHREAVEIFEALLKDSRVDHASVAYGTNRDVQATTLGDVAIVYACLDDPANSDAFARDWGARLDRLGIDPSTRLQVDATCWQTDRP